MEKRVVFPFGKQKVFITNLREEMNLSWEDLSEKLGVNKNTLSKAYLFETCSLPLGFFKNVVKFLDENEFDLLKKYNAEIREGIVVIGRKAFGEQRKKFEQINITYTNSNLKLDNSRVCFSSTDKTKNILLPEILIPELAEEIGMHYGDGFLSSKRFTYRLKGNFKDEQDYYRNYILPLFKRLYNLDLNLKRYQTTYGFEVYSQAICEFKTKTLGIKSGNKQYLEIPACLKVNNLSILTSFLRGLFDTDGCISFKSKYGYKRYYPTIELSLYSISLVEEIYEILKMFGFNPSISYARGQAKVSLNGVASLKRYEKMIGWSSPKNLNKVKEWKLQYPELNKENMANVF